ncbi:DNA-3-methyladenine glycosylase 2 family protein [Natronorubrum sp. JWXQ-INN-674]|uniref:DNA-3-methyladenine glycosylase 2 family protein n=1 Tax=Natronorubrum halalkaliphilum TaxID=2691917 RepID=A0A6B0VS69_9EURY|nr:DNA-3-methyladenine glycosylase 2 family protein [Natronorubrum halalkaliphilum]MXV63973.1 DNA-3-methyladenine glycosylase 2 family protein [Natronorubrum halalkaliphilum]
MLADAEPMLRQDPVMAELIERHDPYVEPNWDEFERLCISIINQQLSTASAAAVRERVFELFRDDVTPEAVLEAEDEALRSAGLSRQKVEYVRNAARAFQEQDFTREGLSDHSNDEVIDLLTEIKGIGDWTARMYLLFVLERPDILPLGDLAVRRGIEQLYGNGDEELTRAEMREIADAWRPYRSVATRYIWAEYESE